MTSPRVFTRLPLAATFLALAMASPASGQASDAIRSQAAQQKTAFLDTLKALVSIESGSSDVAGVTHIGEVIASRLRELGGEVETIPVPADMVRFDNTPAALGPMVVGRFRGTGTRKILLLAHMDTVYAKGMLAQQPFRIEGDRAYGLGIADDKHGVALILHTLAALKALQVDGYGLITVLITPDEEVSSAGSRAVITKLGSEHDVVFSCEGAGPNDAIGLATAGIAAVQLRVKGRASHAGNAPQDGRNALTELAHQIMQMRDLSDATSGIKLNWTLATAGSARNVIPAEARATADVRVLRLEDYDLIEKKVRDVARTQLISDAIVEIEFERTRPPLQPTERSLHVAEHARRVYAEVGKVLTVNRVATGGGTDAAFAASQSNAAVIEGLGLKHFGSHSNDAEYIEVSSIEPRLFLLTRLIADVASGTLVLDSATR